MLTFMIIMVSITFICVALVTAMGVDIDKSVAKKIATDHLCEFPKYYSKGLIPMEKKLKK